MLYSSNLSFNLPISLQLYLTWYLTFPVNYTFEVDLHLLLVFSAYFFMGFVFLNCKFIFNWKPICGNSLKPVLTVSSSSEYLCLLSPSIIGTIYPGPSSLNVQFAGVWTMQTAWPEFGYISTREMFYTSTLSQGRVRQISLLCRGGPPTSSLSFP